MILFANLINSAILMEVLDALVSGQLGDAEYLEILKTSPVILPEG